MYILFYEIKCANGKILQFFFTLDNVRICIFCNVSHLMNKIIYTFLLF